jgi:hypothetical protein
MAGKSLSNSYGPLIFSIGAPTPETPIVPSFNIFSDPPSPWRNPRSSDARSESIWTGASQFVLSITAFLFVAGLILLLRRFLGLG